MKKRVFAFLIATMLFSGSAFMSFAENENTSKETAEEVITTGTQTKAQEDVEDVDADIREELEASIPTEIQEIHIGNADEFMEMVENCRLDTWSANKKVILTDDINLIGKDFQGIPSFDGIFDGQGHTVSDFYITKGVSYSGFFTYVGADATIYNLNLSGSVIPEGDSTIVGGLCGDNSGYIRECTFKGVVTGKDYVGGITGINELTGDIRFSTSEGFISGTHFTGGIAGKNDGNIANCRNEALVNTTNTDTEITIDSMEKLNTLLNLIRNGVNKEDDEANSDVTVSDTGGIAGVSIGIIARCINNGEIGYDHVGYNVGGIAGRQSGYLVSCSNNGLVKGRKDVGGIVGQAEPYITVDFATDIAYQLQEAVAKLHDTVSATLNDTKNQSDVITARLAVISKFTGQAVEDTRFIANGTVDFANGISGATNEAFSRVEYVLDEAVKKGGALDNTSDAISSMKDSASNIRKTVNDLDVSQYITSENEKKQYDEAKVIINTGTEKYTQNVKLSYNSYYNRYISSNKTNAKYNGTTNDLIFYDSSDTPISEAGWGDSDIGNGTGSDSSGTWKHSLTGEVFPITGNNDDANLAKDAADAAASNSSDYAKDKYVNPFTGATGINPTTGNYWYDDDMNAQTAVILAVYKNHLGEMADTSRADAQTAMGNLEDAAGSLSEAGKQTNSLIGNVAGKDDIRFPQFSAEYKEHTTSLADNLAAMNDNFGLLNSEVNNATGVMVGDLQQVNDQFNNILNLYTDALDGVLEKDYTDIFNDNSLADAAYTTDATIDSCFNFGKCKGDIDVSGIAGTMAIEYDFDKESDITGIKDSGLNSSYLTKCVLRDNRNYGDITSEKNYAGGICGLQEMGTILNCGSYSGVKSTSGGYVGGIAGSSISYIVESYAKGELDGDSYVGGIAGDGKNIRECLTIISIGSDADWKGAIAGHIAEKGEVRDNFFVSDDLSGIDRVSYSLKAEPVSYEAVFNNTVFRKLEKETEEKEAKVVPLNTGSDEQVNNEENYRELPYEFRNLTVNFVLEDEDLEDGSEKVARLNKNYGDKLTMDEYPGVKNKDGYYAVWDIKEIDKLTSDVTVTATYKRYRTTLSEEDISDSVHQSELLVDGLFKEDDKLIVNRTLNFDREETVENLENYETIEVTVPKDGYNTHQIRFKATGDMAEISNLFQGVIGGEPTLYLVEGDKKTELVKTGMMGEYSTYNIDGNHFILSVSVKGVKSVVIMLAVIAIIILVALIVILIIVIHNIRVHGGKVPKIFNIFKSKVSEKIESKEQLFYDDSKDELIDKKTDDPSSKDASEEKEITEDSETTETEDTKVTEEPAEGTTKKEEE